MKKIKLHWQILISIVLAVAFGSMFSTDYSFSENNFKELEGVLPSNTIEKIVILKGSTFPTKEKTASKIQQYLSVEEYKTYKNTIIAATSTNNVIPKVSWLGDLFMRLLRMIVVPLILFSIITGIMSIGSTKNLGRLGLKTFSYYITTSLFAIVTGLLLVNLTLPGVNGNFQFTEIPAGVVNSDFSFESIVVNIIPDNIFKALAEGNMLSIIFFAILLGYFISKINTEQQLILSKAFNSILEAIMKLTLFVIKLTPIGIFGIVSKLIAEQDDLLLLFGRLGEYMITVILGLAIHFFITLPLILKAIGKLKPYKHLSNMSPALLTAFSTASSSATLPLTIENIEKKSGVSRKISSFTLPLGATINMDGTALYECVAAIFIAQAYNIDLSFGQQIIIVFTALLASIGAAGIPMAGLVMLSVVLSSVGLPLEGIGLILAIDPLLDMFRTTVNVWSDSCGAALIAKSEKEKLYI